MPNRSSIIEGMNKLSPERRAQIIRVLVGGNSIRATCRMTGAAKGTVLKLLAGVGEACAIYHHQNVRGLTAERIQCDEIWAFVYSKEKNVPKEYVGVFGMGDVWTYVGIDALFILQREAALIPAIPCGWDGDVDADGDIDSIDAALTLQFVAQLIAALPRAGG